MRRLAAMALLAGLACAGGPLALAPQAIDWPAAGGRWSLHIVTLDPDGDDRVTRIWVAVLDGEGVLRTGASRWWQNLERDPECRIRVLGSDYPVRAEPVTRLEERARIDDAFGEKYGWLERLLFWKPRGETHENYARLRARQPESR